MSKIIAFLSGKKTYIIALVAAATAFADSMGWNIPAWVYVIEGALGITAMRAGVSKSGE